MEFRKEKQKMGNRNNVAWRASLVYMVEAFHTIINTNAELKKSGEHFNNILVNVIIVTNHKTATLFNALC